MPTEIKCQVCGKVFVGRKGSKYCGKECARKVQRMREKQVEMNSNDAFLASAEKAVDACDKETIDRLMSILATNKSYVMIKSSHVNFPLKRRTCAICGRTFDANSATQKYCGQGCLNVARKSRGVSHYDRNAEIAVGALTGKTRTRLAAMLEGVA